MKSERNEVGRGRKQVPAIQSLARIKPTQPKQRFLVSWDSQRRVLRYGCGDGENEVDVWSDGRIEMSEFPGGIPTKLRPECVCRFRSGTAQVSGANLVNKTETLLRSYLHLPDERLYRLFLVWSIATYVYPLFSHFGYLYLHSTSPRCGKTRVEEILSHLCFEATTPLNSPTTPTIRDTATEGRTLVLDTLERWKGKNAEAYSAAMEFLDAGFRNGGTVAKMITSGNGQWRKEFFPVYAPYVLAAIHRDSLTDTALDRSFVIELYRKPVAIKKLRYDFRRCEEEFQPLRDDLYMWALRNATEVAKVYDSSELETELDTLVLNDRAADIWKPLLAVARVLESVETWEALTALAVEMGHDPEAAERDRVQTIICSLRKLAAGSGKVVRTTSGFVEHLRTDGPVHIAEHELHDMLIRWGFSQTSVRLAQGPRRAWELQDSTLAQIESENRVLSLPPV